MKWLTLEYIKAHSRIDFDIDDTLLELYANAAEETVLNIIRRTYDDVLATFCTTTTADDDGNETTTVGNFPNPLMQAALMLVDHSYQQRTPASAQQLYTVPYAFDFLVKPYMKL